MIGPFSHFGHCIVLDPVIVTALVPNSAALKPFSFDKATEVPIRDIGCPNGRMIVS
jgi:hypothetical protein